jgi:hypothetical protein
MTMSRLIPSVRVFILGSLTITVGILCFLHLRAFGEETARSIGSLTPDQRNHLPEGTKVTLPGRGTVTLGTLREEHRARMERFSRAALWGKRVAERMPKPTPVSSLSAQNGVQPGRTTGSKAGAIQNSSALPQQPPARPGQPQQKQGGAVVFSKSNASGGSAATGLNASAKAVTAVQSTLVPRQAYNVPIPKDYTAFCNAAQASACVYLPPNTTVTTDYTSNLNNPNAFVLDVDPLITDPATCTSLGGSLDSMQQCVFKYFSNQQTNFKYPGGTPSWAYNCDPGYYRLDVKDGMVSVDVGFFTPYTTGAAPFDCVIQLWFNQ